MSAEARTGGERAFEIDEVAGFFFAEDGAPQSFAGKIGGKMVRVEFDHGEAAAVHRNAVAKFHFARDIRFGARRVRICSLAELAPPRKPTRRRPPSCVCSSDSILPTRSMIPVNIVKISFDNEIGAAGFHRQVLQRR